MDVVVSAQERQARPERLPPRSYECLQLPATFDAAALRSEQDAFANRLSVALNMPTFESFFVPVAEGAFLMAVYHPAEHDRVMRTYEEAGLASLVYRPAQVAVLFFDSECHRLLVCLPRGEAAPLLAPALAPLCSEPLPEVLPAITFTIEPLLNREGLVLQSTAADAPWQRLRLKRIDAFNPGAHGSAITFRWPGDGFEDAAIFATYANLLRASRVDRVVLQAQLPHGKRYAIGFQPASHRLAVTINPATLPMVRELLQTLEVAHA